MIIASSNHPILRFSSKDASDIIKLVYKIERKKLPDLAVIFTFNGFIRRINREFLRHNYVTDVITFCLGKDGGAEGEIYINLDAAKKQANYYKIPYAEEVRRLLIHGTLHLIGYDDGTAVKRKKMSEKEDKYLELIRKRKTSR